MKKILVAVDSFKESMTSLEIGNIINENLENETIITSIADGGEGTLETLEFSNKSIERFSDKTYDALLNEIIAEYGYDKDNQSIYLETAKINGLDLINNKDRNIYISSTYGIGITLKNIIKKHDPKNIYLTLGGSATNDAGIGILLALGANINLKNNEKLTVDNFNIKKFIDIESIEFKNEFSNINFEVITDVDNYLFGEKGASYIFGKQKGLEEKYLDVVENGIRNIFNILGYNKEIEGAGAAGGLGAFFMHVFKSKRNRGVEFIFEKIDLETKIKDVDIVISGEGKIDSQSIDGKVISEIYKLTKKYNKELILICGIKEIELDDIKILEIKKENYSLRENIEKGQENLKDIMIELSNYINK